ncbi:DUF4129 domain-containing protein [Curtobacterium sp. Leaf261]|uniref:DUF4129 domain-containing protein n=1 Tax=Curtobacterium sp. Leaf261 TaxID=1736311 RepID=UPI0006F9AABA|nr:DUF4129 domain-containing protein [Curtobacterium sp. Leaf261]KQO64878.1 hypothetical protein ASF23_01480 [Curtobacterium sp. Leaf261]
MRVDDERGDGFRLRRVLTGAVGIVLGVVVVLGATLGRPLVFSGPRWSPDLPQQTVRPEPLPSDTPSATVAPQRLGAGTGGTLDLRWLLVVAGVLVLGVIAILVVWLLRRRARRRGPAPALLVDGLSVGVGADPAEPSLTEGTAAMRRGLRRALGVLDDARTPSDAITEAWLGLQESAEDAGFRRGAAETPTEFTARILRRLDVDPGALETLRRLYASVRFGGVVASPADVERAREALRTLDLQWSATGGARP